jgi:hypothetical protein
LHLLLGDPHDLCCASVRDALAARGYPTHVSANPLAHPSRLSWWLDGRRSATSLAWEDRLPLRDGELAGVLVLGPAPIDPVGWAPDDLAYVQAETQAALLAWLWSLDCPVVNRYPAAVWYRPRPPLLAWYGLLRRAGLPTLDAVVTNVEDEARAFAARSTDGVVYGPLTSDVRYLVASEEDWNGLAALQRVTPVWLSPPHGEARPLCVVGEHVVWEGEPVVELEPALRRFAAALGLACVQLAHAPTAAGLAVVAVETRPYLEQFGAAARAGIVDGIVELLT